MPKLVLTSKGLNTLTGRKLISKTLPENKWGKTILLVDFKPYEVTEILLRACMKMGFQEENIILATSDVARDKYVDYVYVTEGNTFEVLDFMRKNGLVEYIQECIAKGATYIGASAGAMIAGVDIECALDFDSNFIHISDYSALQLFDGTILPHYDKKEYLDNYIRNSSKELISKYERIYYVGNQEAVVMDVDTGTMVCVTLEK